VQPAGGQAQWKLLRNRALAPRQFCGCLLAVAGVQALFGVVAWAVGYWPVALFCVLVLMGAVAAFLHHAGHVLDGEHVSLLPEGAVEVRVVCGARETRYRFASSWLRIERAARIGSRPALWIASGRQRVLVGRHLSASRCAAFEAELRQALRADPR
jgi:uncharacterized membrane protein